MASEIGEAQTGRSNSSGVVDYISYFNLYQNCFGKADHREWKSCMRNGKKNGSIQSTTEHVKFCWKQVRPRTKAKYSLMTDSEAVPWGKVEKNPGRGVKRTWNPMFTSSQRALRLDGVLFVERSGELYLCCEVKNYVRFEAEGKPSLNRANR